MSVFETTKETLERLSVRVGHPVIMLSDAENKLKSICDMTEYIIDEFEAETYTVSIVPESLILEINVQVPEMVIEDCENHVVFKLVEMCDNFGFSADGENISIDMSVGNLFSIAR